MCNASVSFHVLPAAKQKSREGREGPKAVLLGCAFPGSFAGPWQPEDLLQCWELFYHCLSLQLNLLRKVILCPNPHPGLSLRKMVRVGQGLFFLGSCQHRAQSSARGESLQVPGQRCARVCPGPVQSPHCSRSTVPIHDFHHHCLLKMPLPQWVRFPSQQSVSFPFSRNESKGSAEGSISQRKQWFCASLCCRKGGHDRYSHRR